MARKPPDKSKGHTQTSEKYSSDYWGQEIANALKRHEKHFFKEAEESIKVYNSRDSFEGLARRANVWWYIVNTLLPALYSSTPRAEVNLRKYAGSQELDLAAVLLERNTQRSMDLDFDFDFVGFASALSLLLTGRAVLWSKLRTMFGEANSIKLTPGDGGLYLPDGSLYEGAPEEVENEGSEFSYNLDTIESQSAILEFVAYNDYLNSDARNEEEITWRAKRGYLDEEQAEAIFGKDTCKKLKFDAYPDSQKESKINREDRNPQNGKADVWELWSEETGEQIFIQSRGKSSVVEKQKAPIKYPGFYPCSVVNQSIDPNSTIPVSDFTHTKDQILEVERLAERKHALIQAIRTNGIYNPTLGDVMQDMFKGDLQMRPVKQWEKSRAAGGLSGGTEYLNIDPYVKALQIIGQEYETAKQGLFQSLKVSDLMQGISNPIKTATANRLENQWSSMGLIVRQLQFSKFIGDAIEKLGTVIATSIPPEVLLERGDAQSLFEPLQQEPDPETGAMGEPWQEMANRCAAQLKNSNDLFKLVIASDSMIAVDQKQERADNADLLQSTGSFFREMKDMITEYPPMVNYAIKFMQRVSRNYKGGKEDEAMYSDMLEQVGQIAEQKMAAAAQAPPDPAMVKAQSDMQIAQMAAQGKQAEVQASMQKSQVELQISQVRAQMEDQDRLFKAQIEQAKQELEAWKAQQQVLIDNKKLEVEVLKIQSNTEIEKANQQIAIMQTNLAGTIDALRLKMDQKDSDFAKLASTVEAHQRHKEHQDNHIAELSNIMQSTATDKPEKVKASVKHYKFIKDHTGEITGAVASQKPEEPGSLKS
jgi:hypothetical protein